MKTDRMGFARHIVFCAAFFLLGCRVEKGAEDKHTVDAEIQKIAENYVAEHRAWKRDDYRIEPHGQENGAAVVWIVYLPEEKLLKTGGSSFEILVRDGKVVKELGFQ